MALAGVLSAMREIILDAPELPEDQTARLKVFEKSFPQLTPSEREDLSKISPEKFGIYTTSIFVGEKNIIANNFPMTVKVLETYWPSESEGKFSLFKLTSFCTKLSLGNPRQVPRLEKTLWNLSKKIFLLCMKALRI